MVRVHPTGRLSAVVSWLRPRVAQGWAWAGRPTQTAAPRSCYPSLRSLRQTARAATTRAWLLRVVVWSARPNARAAAMYEKW